MKKLILLFCSGLFALNLFSQVGSSHQAYATSVTNGVQNFGGELGMIFKVNNSITINALGAFDDKGNGVTGTQNGGVRVAIFNKATKAIVPGLDAVVIGQADGYNLGYRFKTVAPVNLTAGEYVIVAKGYNQNELNGNTGLGSPVVYGDLSNGVISYVSGSLYGTSSTGFNYPTNGDGNKTYLAGSFSYLVQQPTPISDKVVTPESVESLKADLQRKIDAVDIRLKQIEKQTLIFGSGFEIKQADSAIIINLKPLK